MQTLKYKVIKTESQYDRYCKMLEQLLDKNSRGKTVNEEIELITLLIEKWDEEHNTFNDIDPIGLIRSLMDDHHLKAKELAKILGVEPSLVSEILNYKKGLSKNVIRSLSNHFKLNQEAFNRPYKLKSAFNSRLRDASVMNTPKELVHVR
ncbi:MAG: transcriptional regulator [Bacteroidota bacterium]